MVKFNSVSGVIFLVKDLDKSSEFYEKLGFGLKDVAPGIAKTAYVNWFWIELLAESAVVTEEFKDDAGKSKGAGQYIHISVEDVDEYHTHLLLVGFKPLSEPKDFPWGRREFSIADPDGYKLVFFSKN